MGVEVANENFTEINAWMEHLQMLAPGSIHLDNYHGKSRAPDVRLVRLLIPQKDATQIPLAKLPEVKLTKTGTRISQVPTPIILAYLIIVTPLSEGKNRNNTSHTCRPDDPYQSRSKAGTSG